MKNTAALILALITLFSSGAAACSDADAAKIAGNEFSVSEKADKSENKKPQKEETNNMIKTVKAEYPADPPYPTEEDMFDKKGNYDSDKWCMMNEEWQKARSVREEAAASVGTKPFGFYKSMSDELLSDNKQNRVISPVSAYMALAMLAETTGGSSREQILDLLGSDDIADLRKTANGLWRSSYRDDGTITTLIADSLWLDDDFAYKKDAVDTLAKSYYASTFSGDMASPEMTKALRDWINEQTGGFLEDQVNQTGFSAETVMALCSTLYFRGKWNFSKDLTAERVFHGANGDETVDFMNDTGYDLTYYYSDDYGAVELPFENGTSMWFILPDEDKTVDEVLDSGEYLDMTAASGWKNKKQLRINYSVPKFDISSDIQLRDQLIKLGVKDVFSGSTADFTPMTDEKGLFVGEVKQAARVSIDEEGCTAAAFTLAAMCGSALPPELDEIDFVLDRPFVFVISSDAGQPLFIGTIYDIKGET